MQGIDEEQATIYASRNDEIYELYKSGMTLEKIGEKFDITKKRVHQIIRRCKIGDGDYYDAQRIEKDKLADDDYYDWLFTKGIKQINKK